MSKLEERESRRRSAVGKFVEQTPMAAASSRPAGPAEGEPGAEEAD